MTNNGTRISLRRAVSLELGSYNDRNDGFERSFFSRSKNCHSRNTKSNKIARVRAPWKV